MGKMIGFKTVRALVVIARAGRDGIGSGDFGAEYFGPDRTSKASSMGGGGDYGALMLLGRLKSAGYVCGVHNGFVQAASRWRLTTNGRVIAERWAER